MGKFLKGSEQKMGIQAILFLRSDTQIMYIE